MLQKAQVETMKCSLCGKEFFKTESRTIPFCSKRCQQVDLGFWLNESYSLPMESGADEPFEEPQDEED